MNKPTCWNTRCKNHPAHDIEGLIQAASYVDCCFPTLASISPATVSSISDRGKMHPIGDYWHVVCGNEELDNDD